MEFLGFEFRRRATAEKQNLDEFIPKQNDDGSLVVAAGGSYGTVVDLEGAAKNESELVTKYREMVMHAEVESAVDDIVNILNQEDYDIIGSIVYPFLNKTNVPDKISSNLYVIKKK